MRADLAAGGGDNAKDESGWETPVSEVFQSFQTLVSEVFQSFWMQYKWTIISVK
jgi:hypothetical protein